MEPILSSARASMRRFAEKVVSSIMVLGAVRARASKAVDLLQSFQFAPQKCLIGNLNHFNAGKCFEMRRQLSR